MKKLRRKKTTSYAQANEYLESECLVKHNRRFSRAAAQPLDYHPRVPSATELDKIF